MTHRAILVVRENEGNQSSLVFYIHEKIECSVISAGICNSNHRWTIVPLMCTAFVFYIVPTQLIFRVQQISFDICRTIQDNDVVLKSIKYGEMLLMTTGVYYQITKELIDRTLNERSA